MSTPPKLSNVEASGRFFLRSIVQVNTRLKGNANSSNNMVNECEEAGKKIRRNRGKEIPLVN